MENLTQLELELRSLITRWNASSGSLESDACYVEELCFLLAVEDEPSCFVSEREKLSYIWKTLNPNNRNATLTPNRLQKIKTKLIA